MKRLGIFGGSFAPLHLGHIKSAFAFYDLCQLDQLLIIPAGIPPHKQLQGDATSQMRYHMAELAFAKEKCGGRNISVSDYELQNAGKSYSYLTVSHFAKEPDTHVFLLMGSDMFLSLEHWMHPEILLKKATVVLNRRETEEKEEVFLAKKEFLEKKFGGNILFTDFTPLPMSSSEVRKRIAEGASLSGFLDPNVEKYIRENRLFGSVPTEASAQSIRNILPGLLSEKRRAHVLAVAEEVLHMSKLYDLPEEQMAVLEKAALLHDITHEKSFEEQLQLIREEQIPVEEAELSFPPVLHQITGGYYAKKEFGVGDAVVSTISCHTTGKPAMTLPEKILCLADYIEPTRSYPACQALRADFYNHFTKENRERLIDEAMMRYLENTVAHLTEKREKIHPRTLETLNYFKSHLVNYRIL